MHTFLWLIFWRDKPSEAIRMYSLLTVIHGTFFASFHALRVLKEQKSICLKSHPLSAIVLDERFYIDDCFSKGNILEESIQAKKEQLQIFNSTSKWTAIMKVFVRKQNSKYISLRIRKRLLRLIFNGILFLNFSQYQ